MLGEIPRMTRRRGVPFYLLVHVLYATGESTLVRDYEFCLAPKALPKERVSASLELVVQSPAAIEVNSFCVWT